jgi:hypothetical protein
MQQVVFLRGVITSSILHVRCNNVWRITWEGGGGAIWILQNGGRKCCVKTSIWFFTIILSFGKTKFFFRNSCFPVRSVFVFNVSLFTSGVCGCQNGLRRKHGKWSLCKEWIHFFMNQKLNHLVLYKKCNCNMD